MSATLTVLGAGSILPRAGYGCSGYALRPRPGGPVTLLDCGPGSIRALGAAGIELGDVRRVVVSHFHTDHCLDLFALFFARRNPAFEPPPLEVVGPVGLAALVETGVDALRRHPRDPRLELVETPLDAGGVALHEAPGEQLVFRGALTGHTPEALAWRVELADGAALGYTGDSGENPAVAEHVRGVDVFLAECSFPDEARPSSHLTPSSAARLARAAGCRRLVLTHFYPEMDPESARAVAARTFDGPIELARDGSVHAIG